MRCWLEEVFGDNTVPQYEINVKMVVMLHDLMQRCKERDTDKQILIDDLNDKTTEYHGEGKILS